MTKPQWYIQSKSHIGTPVIFWDTFCLNPPPCVTGLKHFSAVCVCMCELGFQPPGNGTFHGFQGCLRHIWHPNITLTQFSALFFFFTCRELMKFAHPNSYLGENLMVLYWHQKTHSGSFIVVYFFKIVINLNLTCQVEHFTKLWNLWDLLTFKWANHIFSYLIKRVVNRITGNSWCSRRKRKCTMV